MRLNGRMLFWLAVVAQVVMLLAFVGLREFTLRTGREVVLQTVPVDPRDLFRGDYVVLRYDISTVPTYEPFALGDTAYVTLVPSGDVWRAEDVSPAEPTDARTFIRGRVTRLTSDRTGRLQLEVEYGIESYFVPEGQGREIEQSGGQLRVRVVVDGFGTAAIRDLSPG